MSNLATITNNILADSGIDDINVVVTNGSYSNPSWITALSWTKITDRPNTIAGYGITDAYTQTQVNNLLSGYLPLTGGTLTGPLNGTSIALTAGITPTKTAKNAYAIQIRGAFYGAPRLQLYDLAADPNAFIGLGVDMSGAAYEFSNYFPRTGGNGRWSVGSWAGDFGTGQYVSGYNEKLFITENAAQFNVAFTLSNLAGSGTRMVVADANGLLSTQAIGSGSITGSGTTNYIPKFTGSTTVGNSNLVDVSGYLVLGNTSSVYGQAGRGTFEMNGSADNILAMRIGGSLAGYLYTNSSNMELYSTTNIQFSTAGTIRATLFSDGNFTLSNSPSNAGFKLDVNGTGRYSGNLQLGTIGGGSGTATPNNINLTSTFSTTAGSNLKLILFNDTGGNIYGLGVSNSQMDFSVPVGANYRFYTGNVGIGATPNQRLQVDGGSLLVNSGTAGNTSFRDIMIGGISGWSNNESHGIDAVYGSSGSPVTFSRIESHFNGVSGRIRFRNLFNNSAPQTSILMTIEANGNVLIGDTSDNGARLQVSGTSTFSGELNLQYNNAIQTIQGNTGFSLIRLYGGNGSSSNVVEFQIRNRVDGGDFSTIGNFSNHDLQIRTNNTARLTIAASTGAATFSSSVQATNMSIGFAPQTDKLFVYNASGTNTGLTIQQDGTGDIFRANGNGGANRLVIQQGGNVGIGTPSPQDRLDVNGSIRFRANTPNFTAVTDNGVLDYVPTSVFATTPTVRIASIGTASVGGQIRFLTGTSSSLDTRMTIDSSGNVGIGVTPSAWNNSTFPNVLQVGFASLITNGGAFSQLSSNIFFDGSTYRHITTGGIGRIGFDVDGAMFFGNASSQAGGVTATFVERMRITSGGNVLIGNANDNGLGILQVNGNIILAGGSSSGQTQLSSGFTTLRFPNQFSSGFTDAGVKLFIFNSGATIQGFTAGPQFDLQYHSSGSSSGRHAFYVGNQEIIRFNQTTVVSTGSITATSFFESSDATLKTLVQDNYQAKGIDSVVAKLYIKNGKQELGYFAQDLQEVLPSAVSKGSDGLLNLSYREVHTAKIAYLEERIKQLEKKYENN